MVLLSLLSDYFNIQVIGFDVWYLWIYYQLIMWIAYSIFVFLFLSGTLWAVQHFQWVG